MTVEIAAGTWVATTTNTETVTTGKRSAITV
jgi:hypothetical protein